MKYLLILILILANIYLCPELKSHTTLNLNALNHFESSDLYSSHLGFGISHTNQINLKINYQYNPLKLDLHDYTINQPLRAEKVKTLTIRHLLSLSFILNPIASQEFFNLTIGFTSIFFKHSSAKLYYQYGFSIYFKNFSVDSLFLRKIGSPHHSLTNISLCLPITL